MNHYSLARMAVKIFPRTAVPRQTTNNLRRGWMKSVIELGDRHVLKGGKAKWGNMADKLIVTLCVISAFPWERL